MLPLGCNSAGARWLANHCLIWLQVALLFVLSDRAHASNVKWMIKDPTPLVLPPSAFTASSVHATLPDSQADKANLAVFASPEEASGAWCPANPVQTGFTEWLQVDFDDVKIMRILFTEGRGRNQPAYVPSFVIRYQRCDSQKWLSYRMLNGSQLLYTNQNIMTVAITLDPLIIAKRFRIYPYYELEPRNMCLRLAVYGSDYNDGVVNYTIPEGDVYRLDADRTVTLNDTNYDGHWTQQNPFTETLGDPAVVSFDRRAYLYGGLGLLMDKQYYEGPLLEPRDRNKVVGWFRRRHSVPTSHVTMQFNFDQVRNFSEVRLHTLNSLDYVSVFRRVLVQFSVGGQHFDRIGPPVLTEIRRDTSGQQARWVLISLDHRVGRSLRITLWFDYDWIMLSEVMFSSVPVLTAEKVWPPEKPTDPVHRLPTSDLPGTELTKTLSQPEISPPTINSPVIETYPARPIVEEAVAQPHHSANQHVRREGEDSPIAEPKRLAYPTTRSSSVDMSVSTMPYLIAIVCSCLGLLLFTILFSFMFCRFQRSRRDRVKKLHCGKMLIPHDGVKHSQQSHQFSPVLPSGNYFTSTSGALPPAKAGGNIPVHSLVGTVSPDAFLSQKGAETALLLGTLSASSSGGIPPQGQPYLDSIGHFSQTYPLLDHMEGMSSPQYKQLVGSMHPDSLLALQLLQQSSNLNSTLPFGGLTLSYQNGGMGNFESSATLARRYLPTGPAYPLPCMPQNFNGTPGKLPVFRPPPPPDQPLPPLPVSGVSSNTLVPNYAKEAVPQNPSNAFCLSHYPADTNAGFLMQFDGSMPEYASASIFSGSGAMQSSPGLSKSITSTNTYRPVASSEATDSTKFPGISETYCVPHHNSIHRHFGVTGGGGLWPSRDDHANLGPTLLATSDADRCTESLDSSGMYYFSNSQDQSTSTTIAPYGLNQRPLLLPFTQPSQPIPVHSLNHIGANQQASGLMPQPKDASNPLLGQSFSLRETISSSSAAVLHQPSLPKGVTSELPGSPPGDAPPPPGCLSSMYQKDDPHRCLAAGGVTEASSTLSTSNQQGLPSTVHNGSSYNNCSLVA